MTATLVGFWGHLTLVAIERRIVYFCEVNQLYFVDQKRLMLLRLELHIALHVFKKDLQAIFATATYVLPDIVFLPEGTVPLPKTWCAAPKATNASRKSSSATSYCT